MPCGKLRSRAAISETIERIRSIPSEIPSIGGSRTDSRLLIAGQLSLCSLSYIKRITKETIELRLSALKGSPLRSFCARTSDKDQRLTPNSETSTIRERETLFKYDYSLLDNRSSLAKGDRFDMILNCVLKVA